MGVGATCVGKSRAAVMGVLSHGRVGSMWPQATQHIAAAFVYAYYILLQRSSTLQHVSGYSDQSYYGKFFEMLAVIP